jgi:transcriptional regulator GlxA family with amidase domain
VEDGHGVTSAGISAGIAMALRGVIRYFGEAVGRATARNMGVPLPGGTRRRV